MGLTWAHGGLLLAVAVLPVTAAAVGSVLLIPFAPLIAFVLLLLSPFLLVAFIFALIIGAFLLVTAVGVLLVVGVLLAAVLLGGLVLFAPFLIVIGGILAVVLVPIFLILFVVFLPLILLVSIVFLLFFAIVVVVSILPITIVTLILAGAAGLAVLFIWSWKWIYIGLRDWIFWPIWAWILTWGAEEALDEVTEEGNTFEPEDPAAVIEAINCEYEPDHPSCPSFEEEPDEIEFD